MSIVVTEPATVHAVLFAALSDLLAWLADSPDNAPEDYPGPGWDVAEGGVL